MHTGKESNSQTINNGGADELICFPVFRAESASEGTLCKIRCHTMTPETARQHSCLLEEQVYDNDKCCHKNVIRRDYGKRTDKIKFESD